MTGVGLNGGAAGTVSSAARFFWRAPTLFSGVSLLALLASGLVSPVSAAAFTAADQTELGSAIAAAQASPDAASTITLTDSFSITSAPAAVGSKNITIATGANTLTLASGTAFNVGTGAALTITGNVLGNGVLNQAVLNKTGTGNLVINGVTATGVTHIGVLGGTMLINGGSDVSLGAATGGTTPLIAVARNVGEMGTLTISGTGTVVDASGTDPVDIGSAGTLNIEAGGVLDTTSALRLYGAANVNVRGEGSAFYASTLVGSSGAAGTINITDGGLISITGAASFGGIGNIVQNSTIDALVSGAGSRLEVGTTLALTRGTLSVLDGGAVEADAVNVATATSGTAVRDFDVLVSGEGSLIDTDAFTVGTRGVGTVTLADDGTVSIGDGAATLVLGGTHVDSAAVLNIGGAIGEAAAGGGVLDASAVTLAASAEINFNHTGTGYVFDVPINGEGAINQVAGRTIFNADQLGFTGLTTIAGGMLEVNGELGGTVDVLGGTLAGIGRVGATSVAAGGAIAPGSNGIGTLTIDGDYSGDGGLLQIQTALADDSSPTDLLAVTGATSGTTNVTVTNFGGGGGATSTGIKIIDVGGASDGTFSLLGDVEIDGQQAVIGGAYLYGLHQGTLTDVDGDWYLRSILNPDDDTPIFQPAAPVVETYAAAALQAFNTSESLQQRVGNRAWSDGTTQGDGIWGRMEASHTSLDPEGSSTGASYDVTTWRLQAGLDGVISQSEAGTVVGGVNLQVGTIAADIGSAYGDGSIEGRAFGVGGTLTWYGSAGFYLDAQGKLNWFDSDLTADLLDGALVSGNAGFGYALSLEAGQEVGLGGGWSVTPQAQLAYSAVDFDAFDSYGSTVALESGDSLLGRLGISADYESEWQDSAGETGRTHVYGIANVSYEFLDGTATSIGSDTLVNEADPLWGSLGLGGSINWAGDALSLHGEANLGTSLNSIGESYSVGVTAGISGEF